MKEAIELAIEGGWDPYTMRSFDGIEYEQEEIWSDRRFWQALIGKNARSEKVWIKQSPWVKGHYRQGKRTNWRREWHRFIDHLAEGHSPSDFFTNLLK